MTINFEDEEKLRVISGSEADCDDILIIKTAG